VAAHLSRYRALSPEGARRITKKTTRAFRPMCCRRKPQIDSRSHWPLSEDSDLLDRVSPAGQRVKPRLVFFVVFWGDRHKFHRTFPRKKQFRGWPKRRQIWNTISGSRTILHALFRRLNNALIGVSVSSFGGVLNFSCPSLRKNRSIPCYMHAYCGQHSGSEYRIPKKSL
jgi:hypothetical protein